MLETWLRENRVRLPALVMLETWLGENRVRLPALVMLETGPRESGVRRLKGTFFGKLFCFFLYRLITLPLSTLTTL